MIEAMIQISYLFAAFIFIVALRALGRPESARRGMQMAAVGMLVAVLATLLRQRIISYEWIVVGALVGGLAGYPMGMWVPMSAMPQRIALSHAFGALAATLVGAGEYLNGLREGNLGGGHVAALGFDVLLGGLTVTGSLMAAGKLQETAARVAYRLPISECHQLPAVVRRSRLPGRVDRQAVRDSGLHVYVGNQCAGRCDAGAPDRWRGYAGGRLPA